MPYNSIQDAIGVRETNEKGIYESIHPPERMGNAAAIAYGGCTLAIACMTAHQSLPASHRLYSMTGNFLGPALCDRVLRARVQEVRRTRTFTTRIVTVSQIQDDGTERSCLVSLVDFHAVEPGELFRYSKPPTREYKGWDGQTSLDELREDLVRDGKLHPKIAALHQKAFGLAAGLFEGRPCRGSMAAETLLGFAKEVPTDQDGLEMWEKSSGDWWRCKGELKSRAEQAAALAFQMDGAVSFMPLVHSHMSLADAGACSTLDFALRVMGNDFDLNKWCHREWKCIAAGVGRTYSEAQVWDEEGRMIASMTQSCIMRPLKEKGKL
ncbi:acyl-CoA thioesterase II [Myriangium duriaei CBS 260.36]|uniref:Acyl-CoA thioesterase II n=1 Tax=Myriangium duriaei CBS 260.36 TaxID=1168546 RepID=A0A9P4IWD8_9PEZI|nr:acyl-CoA thioesterase II [Myriangium duriaei CBS 260.36]